MSFLVDTNVVSELRKKRRAHSGVVAWFGGVDEESLPTVDGLVAATALVHGLTLVTRNTRDFVRAGVPCLNPFELQRGQ